MTEELSLENEVMDTVSSDVAPVIFNQNNGVERGKFRSLTLINWNGFFARTFDLDELVTTLSGGNGAGKSTTMAGFVTALIPDLTLLHSVTPQKPAPQAVLVIKVYTVNCARACVTRRWTPSTPVINELSWVSVCNKWQAVTKKSI